MAVADSSRVLKAHEPRGQSTAVAFNLDDLRQRGDEYIAQIKQQAQKMIAEARAEAEALRQQASDEGRHEGYQTGLREAQRQIEQQVEAAAEARTAERLQHTLPLLEHAIAAVELERDRWIAHWETSAIKLSLTIAERILRQQLDHHPDFGTHMVAEALQLAAGSPRLHLRLHPLDVTHIQTCGQDIVQRLIPLGSLTFVPDERLSRGECLIETEHGVIDARLKTQLDRILHELLHN